MRGDIDRSWSFFVSRPSESVESSPLPSPSPSDEKERDLDQNKDDVLSFVADEVSCKDWEECRCVDRFEWDPDER